MPSAIHSVISLFLSNHSYQTHLQRNAVSRKTGHWSASSRTPAASHRPAEEERGGEKGGEGEEREEEAGEIKNASSYIDLNKISINA